MSTPIVNSLRAGYEEAAVIRNQLDEPTTPLERSTSALAQLRTRLERLDAQFSDGASDPYLQRQYGSLQFQMHVLAALIESLRLERLPAGNALPALQEQRLSPLQRPERVSPPVTTIGGTLSQYGVKKNGHRVGDGACTYCAFSAIKRLFSPIMSDKPGITSDMIDATVQEGVALSPEDQNYGDFLGLVADEDEQDLRHVYSLNGFVAISGLRDSRVGYQKVIDELHTLAQREGGYLAAGCTFNPMSYALFINVKTNTFYFYDSHGDTSDPTTGATAETGAKAFIKIFRGRQDLIKYLNQRHPFNREHGDQDPIVTYFDGTRVPNYNTYQIVPVSMLAQQNVQQQQASDDAPPTPSTEGDEAMARRLQQEEENRVSQLAQNRRFAPRSEDTGEGKYFANDTHFGPPSFRPPFQEDERKHPPRQGTLSPAATSSSPFENREFVGIEKLKQKQKSLFQKLQTIATARNPQWSLIADNATRHFDWWGFPIMEWSKRKGGQYQVDEAIIEKLKGDENYMIRRRAIVGFLMQSYGWDIEKNAPANNGGKWLDCGVRLYKMRRSLYQFGEYDLLRKVNEGVEHFARHEGTYPPPRR